MANYFNFTATEFSSAIIVFNILFSFVLSLIIAWVYIKTHRGLSYSQSFIFTLVILCILGSVVMMVVRNNIIGAFALLGAFSLIRFRTVIKETKDVAYIFFSLTVGVGIGTNNYMISVLTTVILSAIILILTKYNFGSLIKGGALVIFVAKGDIAAYKEIFKNHLSDYNLLQIKSIGGDLAEYSFSVKVKKAEESDKLMMELQNLPGIANAEFITSKSAIEY